jgi:septum formation inhibitor-activating ATPase MinD
MLKTEYRSLLNFTTIPGRNCVAEIMKLLDQCGLETVIIACPAGLQNGTPTAL